MKIKYETLLDLMPEDMAAELDAVGNDAALRREILSKHCNSPNRSFFFLRGQWKEESIRQFVKRYRPSFKGRIEIVINKLFITKWTDSETINKFTIEV
nr:MAG TPA: hypothetical protein [Caudoviricetes sp.]